MGELILIRHGETEWSRTGQHTGRTDLPLTAAGEAAATALRPRLAGHRFVAVLSSPLQRAMRTAELAGLADVRADVDLEEWDYGGYEGLTTEQIRELRPGWDLWRDGVVPGETLPGETLQQVGARADAALDRIRPLLDSGDVAVITHGHLGRVLAARWLDQDPSAGRLLGHADPGALSVLGTEHGLPVVAAWNVP